MRLPANEPALVGAFVTAALTLGATFGLHLSADEIAGVASLAALASAPAAPSGVQLESVRLENGSTLRWNPNTEADLAGYRIVWRDTTSPFWEHAIDVPKDVTRKTLAGLSKDDVIFGVEAFDSKGHVSPAVYPLPRYTL